MPNGPSPAQPAGGPSQRDPFSEYVNKNNFIPVWLDPLVARGVLHHYGKEGKALVHPHPNSGHPSYAAGGVAGGAPAGGGGVGGRVWRNPDLPGVLGSSPIGFQAAPGALGGGGPGGLGRGAPGQLGRGAPGVLGGPPRGGLGGGGGPALGGIPAAPVLGAPGQAGRSIFAGGQIGAGGPMDRTPVFARAGTAIDGRGGAGRVPGVEVPAAQKEGHDTVHAMLDPGEAIFNKKQLAGIKVKPGKAHLVRDDQKRAMRKASVNAG